MSKLRSLDRRAEKKEQLLEAGPSRRAAPEAESKHIAARYLGEGDEDFRKRRNIEKRIRQVKVLEKKFPQLRR